MMNRSLAAQGDHRIDARRSTCGDVARQQRDAEQTDGDGHERDWIGGPMAVSPGQ